MKSFVLICWRNPFASLLPDFSSKNWLFASKILQNYAILPTCDLSLRVRKQKFFKKKFVSAAGNGRNFAESFRKEVVMCYRNSSQSPWWPGFESHRLWHFLVRIFFGEKMKKMIHLPFWCLKIINNIIETDLTWCIYFFL